MNKRHIYLIEFVVGLVFVVGASATAIGEEFYKGKSIRFIVGWSPGGGVDTRTRIVVRRIAKHIPGNPKAFVQNMPGAGSLLAANYTYNNAKPDGLTVGLWSGAFVLFQALDAKEVKLDARKVGWIGAPIKATIACAVMGFTGLRTLEDVIKSKKLINMGATTSAGMISLAPKFLNQTLGTKFNVITGYRGTARIRVALQSKEVDGACWSWSSIKTTAREMLDARGDDRLIPFIVSKRSADPEIRDLPVIPEIVSKNKEDLIVFKSMVAYNEFQGPFTVPPGVPRERLNILRKAFKAAMEDPELLADTRKLGIEFTYVSSDEIKGIVKQILSIPPGVKGRLRSLYEIKG